MSHFFCRTTPKKKKIAAPVLRVAAYYAAVVFICWVVGSAPTTAQAKIVYKYDHVPHIVYVDEGQAQALKTALIKTGVTTTTLSTPKKNESVKNKLFDYNRSNKKYNSIKRLNNSQSLYSNLRKQKSTKFKTKGKAGSTNSTTATNPRTSFSNKGYNGRAHREKNQISYNSTTDNLRYYNNTEKSNNTSNLNDTYIPLKGFNTTDNNNDTMGLGKVFKDMVGRPEPVAAAPPSSAHQLPNKRQVMQNRFNHGCNFGGLFVQEKWISDEVFGEKAKGSSELDAVKSLVKQYGKDEARNRYEHHWQNFIQDDDWKFLRDAGVTAIRVPIGYWMVNGGQFCNSTPFGKYKDVYVNAWSIFRKLISKADEYGIAILADMHGLPGGANEQDHSGTCEGKAELWHSSSNRNLAYEVLKFVAQDLQPFDNICAIQVVNEATHEDDSTEQKDFYLEAASQIRTVNPDVPLVISDGWDTGKWIEWMTRKEGKLNGQQMGMMLDTHVYKCFGDDDRNQVPDQLVNAVDDSVPETDDVDIMVGEYSCVLDGNSWNMHQGAPREQVVQHFGQREAATFYYRARAGNYFWTYKFEHGRGGEWDFREMTEKGALPNMKTVVSRDGNYYDEQYKRAHDESVGAHQSYWSGVDPNKDWEFWRFSEGFQYGFNDAKAFNEFDNSEIGRLNAWRKSRRFEHVQERGDSEMVWTFEHGFKQGVQAFLNARNG